MEEITKKKCSRIERESPEAREKRLARGRANNLKNKERDRGKRRAYGILNREKISEKQRVYRAANLEKLRAYGREYHQKNRDKDLAYAKAYHAANRDYFRAYNVFKKYNITEDDFNFILNSQGGVCACCGTTDWGLRNPCVDHNHITGEVRGILCSTCNRAIGLIKDDPSTARAMANYLEKVGDYS